MYLYYLFRKKERKQNCEIYIIKKKENFNSHNKHTHSLSLVEFNISLITYYIYVKSRGEF